MTTTTDQANDPIIAVVAQYTKDLSFENINHMSQLAENEEPKIDIDMKVNAQSQEDSSLFEITLQTKILAKGKEKTLFVLELSYVGIFKIENFPEDIIRAVLYVECPRILFPFVRSIIAHAVSEGGFPPLYLSPMNFAELLTNPSQEQNVPIQ